MRKMIWIYLFSAIIVLSCGCGAKTSQEIQTTQMNECFSNTDFVNCSRIDFISYEWIEKENEYNRKRFSCLCRKEDINTIFCKKYDFYESVFRIYNSVSSLSDFYTIISVDGTEKEITEDGKSHYIQIAFDEPITVTLGVKDIEDVQRILYDAETGSLWISNTDEKYSMFAYLSDENDNFKVDNQMISFIEGEWERPPYNTIFEAIDYALNKEWREET